MTQEQNSKQYNLEERTLVFAKAVREFLKQLPKSAATLEDGRQLIRSSGSIGANYIEANEALSKKDFIYRIRICCKEAKETKYWLNLLSAENPPPVELEKTKLLQETTELVKIFGAIIQKSS
jgi:four helix bundle protein